VLSHAIEAYSCNWANDFTDWLALQAARMVFQYLPAAVAEGADNPEAREKMANAAAIAGITLGNSQVALAHALGHSAGAFFKQIPHGRITAVFLPYPIQFVANGEMGRYQEIAAALGLPAHDETEGAASLTTAVFNLLRQIDQPTSLKEAGVSATALEDAMSTMIDHVDMDANTIMSRRIPESEEVEKLFLYAYEGKAIDF